MLAQQPTTMYYYQPPPPRTYAGYRHEQSNGLGATQITIGALCIIFNGVSIAFGDPIGIISHGFWNGIIYIVTGSLGVAAAKNKSKGPIIGFMVMCIISTVTSCTLLAFGVIGAVNPSEYIGYCGSGSYYSSSYYCTEIQVVIAMEACMAILALIEAITAIWGSAICCQAVCCCSEVGVYPTDGMPQLVYPNQMMFVTHQQQMQNRNQQPMQSLQAWNGQHGGFAMTPVESNSNQHPPPQMTTANQARNQPAYKTPTGQYNIPN